MIATPTMERATLAGTWAIVALFVLFGLAAWLFALYEMRKRWPKLSRAELERWAQDLGLRTFKGESRRSLRRRVRRALMPYPHRGSWDRKNRR